jgi:hypothetical protein
MERVLYISVVVHIVFIFSIWRKRTTMLVNIWVSIQLKIKKYKRYPTRTRYDELHVLQKHQNIQFRVSDCSMQCVYIRTFRLPVKTTTHRLSTDAIAETVPIFSTILFNHRIPCPGIYCPKIKIPTAASRSPGIHSQSEENLRYS